MNTLLVVWNKIKPGWRLFFVGVISLSLAIWNTSGFTEMISFVGIATIIGALCYTIESSG